jgi:hypothetical protein
MALRRHCGDVQTSEVHGWSAAADNFVTMISSVICTVSMARSSSDLFEGEHNVGLRRYAHSLNLRTTYALRSMGTA